MLVDIGVAFQLVGLFNYVLLL